MNIRTTLTGLLVALTLAAPGWAADPPAGNAVPRFGIGAFGNAGYGAAGLTAVPGATFLFGDFPVKVHFGQAEGILEGAVNADWLLINSPIPGTAYSWYVGPGVYAAYGAGAGHSVIGTGARAVLGARTVFLDAWETYLAWTPAYGIGWVDGNQVPLWNVDLEFGLRFLFPAGKTEVVVAQVPHPDLALVPNLNAFAPGTGGALGTLKFLVTPAYLDRVAGWKLAVVGSDGSVLAESTGKGTPPASLAWDGKTAGKAAPEGLYTARISVDYTDGQTSSASSRPFSIDMTVPEVTVTRMNKRFSPDGDGKNDESLFQIAAKAKGTIGGWEFLVSDPAGAPFYRRSGEGNPPANLGWNGQGTSGTTAEPGRDYGYAVTVTDDLGKVQASQGVISVDFVHPVLTLAADRAAFSPLGKPDRLTFRIGPEGIEAVTGWKLALVDKNNLAVRELSGKGAVPSSVAWDGKNSLGLFAEGTLTARLTVDYTLDDKGTVDSEPFGVELTAPKLSGALTSRHFLPDGDGEDDTQTLSLTAATKLAPASWNFAVLTPEGTPFRSFGGEGPVPETLAFDGLGDEGTRVTFGTDYGWAFTVVDDLGMSTTLKGSLPVDLPRAPVALTAPDAFSPAGTPVRLELTTDPGAVERLAGWKLTIETAPAETSGTAPAAVRTTSGKAPLVPANLVWDGKNADGKVVDGVYRARLDLIYDRGEEHQSVSGPFLLDTKRPELAAARSDEPWSPDGDGLGDDLGLALEASGASPVAAWTFTVLDPAGNPFTTLSGSGPLPRTIPWNGTSSTGELVASEQKYTWSVTVTDTLGKKNTTQGSVTTDILVLPKGGDLKLDLAGLTFQPSKADLVSDASEAGRKNAELLAKLKTVLTRLSQYRITVIGHAVNTSGTAKEEKELAVLSTARAAAVKAALVNLGLEAGRITAVGKGGTEPVVPHADTVNRWKNRRVEFVLTK